MDEKGSAFLKQFSIPSRINTYDLIKFLGEGSQGSVFLGYSSDLKRFGVCKFFTSPSLTDNVQGKARDVLIRELKEQHSDLLHEASITANLKHPSIARVYDLILEHNCLIFEYIDGLPLKDYNSENKQEWLKIFLNLAETIKYAHSKGVLHRDLKSSDVFVCNNCKAGRINGKELCLKVLDWGISQEYNQLNECSGFPSMEFLHPAMNGTPGNMAPETIPSGRYTPASEVWQLGKMMFELWSDEKIFDPHGIRQKSIYRSKMRDTPLCTRYLLNRMTSNDPRKRPTIEKSIWILKATLNVQKIKRVVFSKSVKRILTATVIALIIINELLQWLQHD